LFNVILLLTNINDEYILKISFILILQNPAGWFFKRTAIEKKNYLKKYILITFAQA